MSKPTLAITMGDPAGVGPETIVGAWSDPRAHESASPLVVGRPGILRRAAELLSSDVTVVEIASVEEAVSSPALLPCLTVGDVDADKIAPAVVSPAGGQAAYDALVKATRLALENQVDGIVTAPLNKEALQLAGHPFPGHTELLAELCGVERTAMMLYLPPTADGVGPAGLGPAGLGVVHVTLHMALREVFHHISREAIVDHIELIEGMLQRLAGGDPQFIPRIGVCALNPHAGESGLFGDEESAIIVPAVKDAIDRGKQVEGPLPADTLMVRAAGGEFDAVVAMYHDQGHIALKLLDMPHAVNITLGLPIVRTSVAHGTAFDRAWQGTADATGMIEAIRTASRLAVISNDRLART